MGIAQLRIVISRTKYIFWSPKKLSNFQWDFLDSKQLHNSEWKNMGTVEFRLQRNRLLSFPFDVGAGGPSLETITTRMVESQLTIPSQYSNRTTEVQGEIHLTFRLGVSHSIHEQDQWFVVFGALTERDTNHCNYERGYLRCVLRGGEWMFPCASRDESKTVKYLIFY